MKFLTSRKTIIAALLFVVALVLVVRDLEDDGQTSLAEVLEIRTSRMLGARVNIHDVDIDRSGGKISVPGLTVANPTGFSNQDMIKIDSISLQMDFEARFIEQVEVKGVEVAIEFQGDRSNLESVGERVVQSAEREKEVAQDVSDEEEASHTETVGDDRDDWKVERVELTDAAVSVQADWTDEVGEFELEGMLLEDLDGRTDDLLRLVAADFLDRVLLSAAKRVEDDRLRARLMEKVGVLRQQVAETER